MQMRFAFEPTEIGTELRLFAGEKAIPFDDWATIAPAAFLPGIDLIHRLAAANAADADGDLVLIGHDAIADLSTREAGLLELPASADVKATVEGRGIITRPDFSTTLTWVRPNGQPVVDPRRVGAWLRIGDAWRRLPDMLYRVAEAVDRINSAPADDTGARMAAIAGLRELLPLAQESGEAESRGLLGTITILQADAFSLDWEESDAGGQLIPILHNADRTTPLLLPEQQRTFGHDQFLRFNGARSMYTLGHGTFLVLSPPLRSALSEVRRVASAPLAQRKSLFAAPRAYLRAALGDDAETTVLEKVFVETAAWSDRVVGLGLWQPRVLPWVPGAHTDWFGPETSGEASGRYPSAGILVGDRQIPLTESDARALQARIEDAIGAGNLTVPLDTENGVVHVPATHETLAALARLEAERVHIPASPQVEKKGSEALIILPNEEAVEIEGEVRFRPSYTKSLPVCLRTALKPHQKVGVEWLKKSWIGGLPGVLLADDMGLGKTLQGLAFLAWLREGMEAQQIERGPILIVAPTGLLENWSAEHERHLAHPGLGRCVRAFGKSLGLIRRNGSDGRPQLDSGLLQSADWVLTTYETLRDYDRDFGKVRFVAALFDEAQKIKTPAVRLTDAAKAMNAVFRIAMTGTPVENRLADLWCIVDSVHPACLGDLKSFSNAYERSPDLERLRKLKENLSRPFGGRPPLLLRRLKEDVLPELPARTDTLIREPMHDMQRAAYDETIAAAKKADRRGAVLETLQRLRSICLHPARDGACSDEDFITASARVRATFRALDAIESAGERALVFLDDLDIQARLVGIIQRRYRLALPPMIINGSVAGAQRQARVDSFQSAPDGFDVMLLSPRAGGVGLTLTRANHVVHLARWWNPAVEDQCTGRVLRIGQDRPVTVHIPMAVLPDERRSFDDNLHALLERKRALMRDALMPPAATEQDREELLSATIVGREPTSAEL